MFAETRWLDGPEWELRVLGVFSVWSGPGGAPFADDGDVRVLRVQEGVVHHSRAATDVIEERLSAPRPTSPRTEVAHFTILRYTAETFAAMFTGATRPRPTT
ncbi:hypothetical protein Ae505Ps2_6210 [Pseudonocardia sp. Ae505_Ps2]|nr:hypothetical protein Ae505Ps2_6210 [Pseudonocardia sp. Ae505_Ps2]